MTSNLPFPRSTTFTLRSARFQYHGMLVDDDSEKFLIDLDAKRIPFTVVDCPLYPQKGICNSG
jgi:hypothetical protein